LHLKSLRFQDHPFLTAFRADAQSIVTENHWLHRERMLRNNKAAVS
jgi:hypothetical protein